MRTYSDRRATPHWAKSGPPLRGWLEQAAGSVAALAGATSPCRALLLASGLLQPITATRIGRKVL